MKESTATLTFIPSDSVQHVNNAYFYAVCTVGDKVTPPRKPCPVVFLSSTLHITELEPRNLQSEFRTSEL